VGVNTGTLARGNQRHVELHPHAFHAVPNRTPR
jgi:hypothetical protein